VELSFNMGNVLFVFIQLYLLLRKEVVKKKFISLFTFAVFCEIFFNLGYLFKLGAYEVNRPYIAQVVAFLWGLLIVYKKIIVFNSRFLLLFYISLIVGILWRLISPSRLIGINHDVPVDSLATGGSMVELKITGYSYIIFIRTILCSFLLVCFSRTFERNVFSRLVSQYVPIFKIVVIFSFFEFISNNFINPNLVRSIVIDIFGLSSGAYTTPSVRGGLYSICLTCWEPSLANFALFFCLLGILWSINVSKNRKDIIYIFISAMMMALSMSLTGLLFIATLLVIMMFRKNVRDKTLKVISILLPISIIGIAIVLLSSNTLNYLTSRVSTTFSSIAYMFEYPQQLSIFNVFGGASETVRFYSMFNNLYVWAKTPLFGVGIGAISCTSGWISAIANVGIIGIIIYLMFYKEISKRMKLGNYRIAAVILGIAFTLQGGLVDIFCSTFYYAWIIIISDIISNYKTKEKSTVSVSCSSEYASNKSIVNPNSICGNN